MSQVTEIDSLYILEDEIKEIVIKLKNLQTRIRLRLNDQSSEYDSIHQVSVIRELCNIRNIVKSLSDDVLNNQLSEPSLAVSHIWHIIELYSNSSETVTEGMHVLERLFKLKMRSMIKPTNYLNTIIAYVQWQNKTVRCFVDKFNAKPENIRLNEIEHLWNWNYRANEGIFFGGATRPLHVKKVTEFSALMSIYYDTLWPIYKENRNALFDALTTLLHQESRLYWPDYEIFPSTTSNTILDKCLQYFFFKDRKNTWFINSSSSDYIPFVSLAREIFAEKFNGSNMNYPDQHNTKWILENLKQRCLNIYNQQKNENNPIIIILLTSKNRFGHRIDVDFIHLELSKRFSTIVTIVDACQDGQAFTDVDIVIYTKRFTSTGAIGLVNRTFLAKHELLCKKLMIGTNLPVGILAQIYISINMINTGLAHGIEDLVNSSRWHSWRCPIQDELHSTIDYPYIHQNTVEHLKDPIRYLFTEDLIGTILILTMDQHGQILLPKLWALLTKQGHSLDCFVMDNPYFKNNNAVHSNKVRELIAGKFINELRQLEIISSDYLAWPLVPYWVSSPDDISIEQLNEHFEICYVYHCCLRISIDRCGYPGKFKRFVEHIDNIFQRNELNVSDDTLGKHSSQWPS
ncbi:unnamed protein product [Rotaria sordida]|uniref:Uncharacterized protein n=1 Tax=Rotaria sordida TaxID=392033 RepID=A0A819C452_9BILA|nr:unnamed protein product [Rotaria sordida]